MAAFLSRIEAVVTRFEKIVLCGSLTLMLLLSSLQVILRNFFDSGIDWGDIVVRHLVLFILFFGASLSTREKRHIQMDISARLVPDPWKPWVDLLINGFCILVTALLLVAAITFTQDEKLSGSILFLNVPTWTLIMIMPIGFTLITVRFVIHFAKAMFVILGKRKGPSDPLHAALKG